MLAAIDADDLLGNRIKVALHQPLRPGLAVARQTGIRGIGADVLKKIGPLVDRVWRLWARNTVS